MFLEPADVQGRKLKRRLGGGYSRGDVEKLLEEVVASYAQVWRERKQLSEHVAELERELVPLRDAQRHLSDSLITAERAAAEVRAQAEEDSKELLEQARVRSKEQQRASRSEHERLQAEIRRLEQVEQELLASLRAFLLAGLELVEDREGRTSPVVEVPVASVERSGDLRP
jgi:cell division initiation protein